jgi:hypothetical protein
MNKFILFFSQLALSFTKVVDKLRFGIKNEQVHFVLLSTCIIFAFANKKNINGF